MGRLTFKGGIHLLHPPRAPGLMSVEVLPIPPRVIIPLVKGSLRAGPVVRPGERVGAGTIVGAPLDAGSVPVHASISGTVAAIGPRLSIDGRWVPSVEIESDGAFPAQGVDAAPVPYADLTAVMLLERIRSAGCTSMTPSCDALHALLAPAAGRTIDTLVVNAVECQPFSCLRRLLLATALERIIDGLLAARLALGAPRTVLAVSDAKPDICKQIAKKLVPYKEIELARCRTKYPQDDERVLAMSVSRRRIPAGGSPGDIGCLVLEAAAVEAIAGAVVHGEPLLGRTVTVTGPTVKAPKALRVPIGTPISFLLNACSVDMQKTVKVVCGRPMQGLTAPHPDVAPDESVSSIVCLDKSTPAERDNECIRCGDCLKVCPMGLVPELLVRHSMAGSYEQARRLGADCCIGCGSCAFVCPSRINIVQYIRLARSCGGGGTEGLDDPGSLPAPAKDPASS